MKIGWVACLLDCWDQNNRSSYPAVCGQWLFTLLLTDLDILIMVLESTKSRNFEAYIQLASNCCVSDVPEVLLQKKLTLKKFGCSLKIQNESALCGNTDTLFPIFTAKTDTNYEHFTDFMYCLTVFLYIPIYNFFSYSLSLYLFFSDLFISVHLLIHLCCHTTELEHTRNERPVLLILNNLLYSLLFCHKPLLQSCLTDMHS